MIEPKFMTSDEKLKALSRCEKRLMRIQCELGIPANMYIDQFKKTKRHGIEFMQKRARMLNAPPITAKELFEQIVEAPPDDTCRTCRFWKPFSTGHWFGYCNNGDETKLFSSGNSMIYYPETFGCIFHRPKEAG